MIIDFVDHHGPHGRRRVGHFIGRARRGHEVLAAGALDIAAERNAGIARPERFGRLKVGQRAGDGGSQIDVAAQFTEGERRDAARHSPCCRNCRAN